MGKLDFCIVQGALSHRTRQYCGGAEWRSKEFDVIATNQINDKFDASPAVAGNELFLRGRETLYCIASQ